MGTKKLLILAISSVFLFIIIGNIWVLVVFIGSKGSIEISECFITEYGLRIVVTSKKHNISYDISDISISYNEGMYYYFYPNEFNIEEHTNNRIVLTIKSNNLTIHTNNIAKLVINLRPNYVTANILFTTIYDINDLSYNFPFRTYQDIRIEILENSFLIR